MNLGFKDWFIPYIEDGSKTHTIRAGKRWRVGMRADLFANMRQPKRFDKKGRQIAGQRLIFRAMVTRVQDISITLVGGQYSFDNDSELQVRIDRVLLDPAETEAFFRRDGFRQPDNIPAFNLAAAFWRDRLPFEGQLIHWDYNTRATESKYDQRTTKNNATRGRWRTLPAMDGKRARKVGQPTNKRRGA